MTPGVCTNFRVIEFLSASSNSLLTSSCISDAFELRLEAAPLAAMLSVSTRTQRPASCSPYSSKILTIPDNSRQLMGRRFSALPNRRRDSSFPPSIHATCPEPQPLASVPVMAASPSTGSSRLVQFLNCSESLHHSRSRQNASLSCTAPQPWPAVCFTMPRFQSTSSP